MIRRAAILAVGTLNVAILVATSTPRDTWYSVQDTVELGAIQLDAGKPQLIVSGMVEAGPGAQNLGLYVRFDGDNVTSQGAIYWYMLPEDLNEIVDVVEIPADACPTHASDLAGQDDILASWPFYEGIAPEQPMPFQLMLVLGGEAVLDGELSILTEASAPESPDGLWVELSEVELTVVEAQEEP